MAKNTEEIRTEAKIGLDYHSNTHPRRVTSQHWTESSNLTQITRTTRGASIQKKG